MSIASARPILPSTNITKLVLASTRHVVTSFILLHPKFAVGALLELGTLHQHDELAIGFVQLCDFAVLCAGELGMHFAFAPETVVFFAGWTSVVVESCVEAEDCLAARSGTPACIC